MIFKRNENMKKKCYIIRIIFLFLGFFFLFWPLKIEKRGRGKSWGGRYRFCKLHTCLFFLLFYLGNTLVT